MSAESPLSVIDSLMPWTYVRQILYFPSIDPQIPQTLRNALIRTLDDVPDLAKRIYQRKHPKGGLSMVGPLDSIDDIFSWQDLSEAIDYSKLQADNYPSPDPSAALFVPPETRPPLTERPPVFRALVTLVKGGFLLCVAVHHCTTDITGFGTILKLWATNCRTGSLKSIGFAPEWLDRTALKTNPKSLVDFPSQLHIRTREEKLKLQAGRANAAFEMVMFRIPQNNLRKLKLEASQNLDSHGVQWLTTNDVLAALLWSAIVKAEASSGLQEPAVSMSTIGIPVNFRAMLHPTVPKDYIGSAIGKTTVTANTSDLLEAADTGSPQSLTPIAAAVRRAVLQVDFSSIRSILSFLETQDDLTNFQLGPPNEGNSIVSWADEGVYELHWGDRIGQCDSVRAQKLNGKRYPIIFPRLREEPGNALGGGLEVLISLEEDVMARLKQGQLIKKFAIIACS